MPSSLLRNWTISMTGSRNGAQIGSGLSSFAMWPASIPVVVTDAHQILEGSEIERRRNGVDRDVPHLGSAGSSV